MRYANAFVAFGVLLHGLAVTFACGEENWPEFRGDGSGIAQANDLPEQWSPEQGIAWKASIAGYGQSAPVVWKEKIFLTSSDGPFQDSLQVHAFDINSGNKMWTREIKATVPVENYFRNMVLISSSDTVDAYDATTGKLLWQHTGLQGNHIPSASIVGNRVFVGSTSLFMQATDPEKVAGSNCCIELTSNDGLPSFKLRWGAQHANSYYSTPLAFGGYVYYVNKVGVLYCIDEESGQQVYAKRIGNPCWASAIGVKNSSGEERIYFVMTNGFTVVLRPGPEYNQIARNQLWNYDELTEASEAAAVLRKANAVPPDQAKPKEGPEKVFAGLPEKEMHQMFSYGDPTVYGVAAVDGNLLIRTGQHLYCVRQNLNK